MKKTKYKRTQRPQRTILEKLDPIIMGIDPHALHNAISLPTLEYKIVGKVASREVFKGEVLPIPTVLIRFLTHIEFQVLAVIMEECLRHEECILFNKEIGLRMGRSGNAVALAMYRLRKMGLVLERREKSITGAIFRTVNYNTIQWLHDLMQDEDPAVYKEVRKITRKHYIPNLTKEDIRAAYNNYILPPDHDIEEEEEYD